MMASTAPLITPHLLSHGTIECEDIKSTRAFLEEFLGLDVIRPLPEAQYMWKGGPWTVVCVRVDGEAKEQSPDNHFELALGSDAEVDEAHARAQALAEKYGIREIGPVVEEDGLRGFILLDMNNVWWKFSNASQEYFDAAFARGDVAA
jgi:catechol 2,3-dioxygenase-like lactoylglutathione lyase family enzyme